MDRTSIQCSRCNGTGRVPKPGTVKKLREKAGIGLRDMARLVGVSPAFLCDVEHGRRTLSPELRRKYEGLVVDESLRKGASDTPRDRRTKASA